MLFSQMLSSINLVLIKPARYNDKILTPAAFKIYNNLLKMGFDSGRFFIR